MLLLAAEVLVCSPASLPLPGLTDTPIECSNPLQGVREVHDSAPAVAVAAPLPGGGGWDSANQSLHETHHPRAQKEGSRAYILGACLPAQLLPCQAGKRGCRCTQGRAGGGDRSCVDQQQRALGAANLRLSMPTADRSL